MDPRDLRVTHNAYLLLLTHTKKLLLMTYFDTTAKTGVSFRTHIQEDINTDGKTEVEVEVVI